MDNKVVAVAVQLMAEVDTIGFFVLAVAKNKKVEEEEGEKDKARR